MADMYNPVQLVYNYRQLSHGTARADAIRYAISQADLNNDIPYMAFLREELCDEASWFADELDVVTVFPELLALLDRYPDAGVTPFQANSSHILDVLYIYGHLLDACTSFYQIPYEDCIKFHNDYKKRWIACGRGTREPYHFFAEFYLESGDMDNAWKFLHKLKASPVEPYDCVACAANTEIKYYLLNNEKEKADKIAKKIENGTLRCKGELSDSLLRMKQHYLKYYILHGDYEKAAETAYIFEHSDSEVKVHNRWASFMCAYVHTNPGRGMRIYKKHWREWEEESDQYEKFYAFKDAACFFKGLKSEKDTGTIKLDVNDRFPLYNEDGIYSIDSLCSYYYKWAGDIANKFDKRNRTSKFINELEISFANAGKYQVAARQKIKSI